jgi:ankyrin repeat protein
VNIDARLSEDGETALHRAASRGHLKAVALLLDRGATVDAVDGEGVTPLILASYRGKTEVAKLLLERGAGVNAQEKRNGLSSLSHAVGRGDKDLVSVLLAHGADPLLKSADGRTPLERAEANGASEIVALLKQAKPKK